MTTARKKEKSRHTLWANVNWSNKVTWSILNKWNCLSQNRIGQGWLTHSMQNVLDLTDLKLDINMFCKVSRRYYWLRKWSAQIISCLWRKIDAKLQSFFWFGLVFCFGLGFLRVLGEFFWSLCGFFCCCLFFFFLIIDSRPVKQKQ